MALKDLEIKNLKPPEKPQKLYDGGGLFLYLAPSGLKSWRHEYAYHHHLVHRDFGPGTEIFRKP
ncbi:MAG: Arm DNA-binding domain-containing protein [Deltaproteobacteria bacterium]|nr:Arm DNA-binding domain-containing protein [Deltaproteobacteria bacterium]